MTPLWISLATTAVVINQPVPAEAPAVESCPATCFALYEEPTPTWEETLSGLGRVWTDEGIQRIAPSTLGRSERLLNFTPGAHVDGTGQLWLSGSRVHTIYLDGVAVDVERVARPR